MIDAAEMSFYEKSEEEIDDDFEVTTRATICECGVRSFIRGGKCVRCDLQLI